MLGTAAGGGLKGWLDRAEEDLASVGPEGANKEGAAPGFTVAVKERGGVGGGTAGVLVVAAFAVVVVVVRAPAAGAYLAAGDERDRKSVV